MRQLLGAIAAAAVLHITPTVVLVKRPDAVERLLPQATSYTARDVHLSDRDAHRLHEAVDWSPSEGVLSFYTGSGVGGVVGSLMFVRVDTPHGPLEIAVGFEPSGVVRDVIVTKATVETKPWVLEALRAGLTDHYRGLRPVAAQAGELAAAAVQGKVGALAAYMAVQVDKGVTRALAGYGMFFSAGGRAD